jgi:hypothetical protein
MTVPRDPGTEPLPATKPESTEPISAGHRPGLPDRQRQLWLVAGVLALVLAFFVGFLVGREQAPAPEQQQAVDMVTGRRVACARALNLADRGLRVLQRALANRVALAQATARGDTDLIGRFQEELDLLSTRFDKVEPRLERATERCRG